MTNPVLQVRTMRRRSSDDSEPVPIYRYCIVYCPGCKIAHHFTIEVLDPEYTRSDGSPKPVWEWDGSETSPTFSPSMLAYTTVHYCEGEHTINICEESTAVDGGFEHCDHRSHGYAWRFPDGSMRHYKTYEEKPPEAEVVITGPDGPHTRDPAWGNCHSFLRNGVWEFLSDSAHELANQRVPMEPLPDWFMKD